jgi:hypothetical protein
LSIEITPLCLRGVSVRALAPLAISDTHMIPKWYHFVNTFLGQFWYQFGIDFEVYWW